MSTSSVLLGTNPGSGLSMAFLGSAGGRYIQTGSWNNTPADFTSVRTGTNPVTGSKVLYSQFTMASALAADWSGLAVQLDYQRTSSASPTKVQACLTWLEGGVWRTRYSPILTLADTAWTTLSLPLTSGSPAPTIVAGNTFLLEIQCCTLSGSVNTLNLANLKFLANGLSNLDYGDYSGFISASNLVDPRLRLGAAIDAELVEATNSTATADDLNGVDDEDGVVLPPLIRGTNATVSVNVTNTTGAIAYLNGWVDYNENNAFDPGEQIIANQTVAAGSSNVTLPLVVSVPSTALLGNCGARFRLTSMPDPGPEGTGGTGEVEDYIAKICPLIVVSPTTLAAPIVGVMGAYTFTQSGSMLTPVQWTAAGLPSWLTLDSSTGVLTGMPVSTAPVTFSITATDRSQCAGTATYTLTPVCPALTVTRTLPAAPVQDSPYGPLTFTASGGTAPYAWTAVGSLPDGLILTSGATPSSATISGTPTTVQSRTFTLRTTDAYGCGVDSSVTLSVGCPSIVISAPGPGALAQYAAMISQTWSATGGRPPYAWSAAGVPAGLTFTPATAALTGTPTAAPGSYTVTVSLTDASGCTSNRSTVITIACPAVTISTASLPNWTVGTTYPSTTLTATTSGTAVPAQTYVWSVSPALPTGMSLGAATGIVSGIPTVATGTTSYVFTAANQQGCAGGKNLSFSTACPAYTITPVTLPDGMVGSAYGPATLSVVGPGFDIDEAFGSTMLETLAKADTLLAGSGLIRRHLGTSPTINFFNSGAGDGHYPGGDFPAGTGDLFALKATCFIAIPTAGTWTFGTNSDDGVRLRIDGSNVITDSSLHANSDRFGSVTLTAGIHSVELVFFENLGGESVELFAAQGTLTSFSSSFKLVGGSGGLAVYKSGMVWTALSALPAGLTMSSAGIVSGTPTAATSGTTGASVAVQAMDANGCAVTQNISIKVCPVINLSPVNLPDATAGINYTGASTLVTASGGTAPYTYSLLAGAPAWLAINASTGQLSGTPMAAATGFIFTVNATDANGCTRSRAFLINALDHSDYGDHSALASASSLVTADIHLGALVDVDASPISNVTATTDDTAGQADEDGVSLPSALLKGGTATVVVTVTNTSGAPAYLNGWIDFNNNGVLTDAGEQIVINQTVPVGTVNGSVSLLVSVPAGAVTGSVGARFRLSSTTSPGSTGASGYGEVEDYVANIQPPLSLGNLVWYDANNNGLKDAAESGIAGVAVQLFTSGKNPLTDTPLAITTTSATGAYVFNSLAPGQYFVYIPVPPAAYPLSSTIRGAADNAVDNDNNGAQTAKGQPVTSPVVTLAPGTESTTDGDSDTNTDLTVDFGFTACLSIGNLVWNDANNNGIRDAGETGIGGVTVQLYSSGADNTVNTADDAIVGSTVTTNITGAYVFNTLLAGNYYVKVTPSAAYPVSSGTPATTDNDVDGNNDGSQPGGAGTALYSPIITLTPGGESIADGDADANTNLSIDFGLFTGFTVGNLVWNDINNNGIKDAGETGIGGLTVELLNSSGASFSPAVTTTTNSSGAYGFTVYQSGTYKLKVTPNASYPRASSSAGIDNGTDNNNDGTQPGGSGTASISFPFTLAAGAEPGTLAAGNAENTIDFGFTLCPPIVITPSTLPAGTMATAYSQTLTASGGTVPYSWAVASGSLPPGLSLSPYTTADVGAGTFYSSIFTPASSVTVDPPNAIIGISLGGSAGPSTAGIWSLQATGGVSVSILGLGLTETGAQVALTGSALQFNMSNNASSLLGALGVGTSITASWSATAKYNTAGAVLALQPNTRYSISFYVDGSNGLLKSGLGIVPTFTAELLDGNGAAVAERNSGTLINLVGLLGTGVTSGSVNLTFDTPSTVAAGAYSLRFKGGAILNTTVLGLGKTFASISNVTVNTLGLDRTRLAGTPTQCGTSAFSIQATEASGCVGSQAYTMAVTGTFNLNPVTLPDATTGSNYSATTGTQISAVGGNAPYYYTLATGTPSWLVINSSTGQLSGTPTSSATGVAITVNALDATNCTGSRTYSINVTGSSDFGDYSRFGSASSTVNAAIRMGALVDAESAAVTNLTATGDDTTGLADEDGVTLPSVMLKGSSGTVTVNVTNTSGGPAYLNGWIDFNNNGVLTDSSEQVVTNQGIVTGTSSSNISVTINVPAGAVTGAVGVRFRLTSTATPGSVGASGNGEVEDYLVNILPPMSIGNLVWNDVNNNGLKDAGESGLAGASVRLYTKGPDNLIGTADDLQVGATQTTTSTGAYLFSGLYPGSYFVRVTPPASIYLSGGTPVTLDNGVDNDNNGTQPGGVGTYCYSPLITLAAASEPTSEDSDNNTDLTVDFGLWSGFTVGDLVWDDLNNDGIHQVTEPGLGGITVQLMSPGTDNAVGGAGLAADTVVQTTATTSVGAYAFYVAQAGNYYVRVFPAAGHELVSGFSVTADNGINDDNNGSQPGGMNTVINSMVFTLAAGTEPAGSGATNSEQTIDFGLRPCPSITINPASLSNAVVSTAYSATLSATGTTGMLAWALAGGSLPVGLSLNPSTGIVSGTAPATTGSSTFTVQVTDALNCSATKAYTLNVIALSIGNLVWNDLNGNGIRDAGEPGVAGAAVKLFKSVADGLPYTADDVQVGAALTTGADGSYLFNNLPSGNYWVQCLPTTALPLASANVVTADNGIDNDNNGSQPSGAGTALRSPLIALSAGAEPTAEDSDNNTDLTVDFGLFQGMSIGDLVWNDQNNNGRRDSGEPGIAGVTVQLFSPGADGNVGGGDDVLVSTTTTDGGGGYLFSSLVPGRYYARLPMLPASTPLASSVVSLADNGVDNDSNGMQTGSDPVYSPVITLTALVEPGSTGNTNADLTIDFGLAAQSIMAIGNLVFHDINGNGHYDDGEGLDGITVQLYTGGQTPGVSLPVQTKITSGGGRYLFSSLVAGTYKVFIPSSEFGSDGPLRGMFSIPGAQTSGDDNTGERGIDSTSPQITGIQCAPVVLALHSAPTGASGETGFDAASDNADDDNTDLTIDFGFYVRLGIGNLVFIDANGDGHASASEGVNGVTVQLYHASQTPEQDSPLASTVTANGGHYLFSDLMPDYYIIHIPASMFLAGKPLAGLMSMTDGNFGDDDVGEDGLNDTIPALQGVSSNPVMLIAGAQPTSQNGETGIDSASDDAIDAAVDLTIDFGFQHSMSAGNLVFFDANNNGHYDTGEGVGGVTVQLYATNDIAGFDVPLLTTTTASNGHYLFSNLLAGSYFVHIPYGQFQQGRPLYNRISMPGVSAAGSDDSVGEKGLDSVGPAYTGISTGDFLLLPGLSPLDSLPGLLSGENGFLASEDNASDADSNLTIDLGFTMPDTSKLGVGNAVFSDLNGNGHCDEGEGVGGVTLRLYASTTSVPTGTNMVATTTTDSSGGYYFGGLTPGRYYIVIPGSNFSSGGKLAGQFSLPGQGGDNGIDDDQDENGDDPATPSTSGVRSLVFNLQAGQLPTDNDTETGKDTYIDYATDANSNLTIDFGFYTPVGIGNLVFVDANGNGHADAGEGVGGVTVQLYKAGADYVTTSPLATQVTSSVAAAKGSYLFAGLQPGSYYLHIPAAMFVTGGPLAGMNSMSGAQGAGDDDDTGEDGIDPVDITTQGISTLDITLVSGYAPTGSQEGGLYGTVDDTVAYGDSNYDLTWDFGFASSVRVGNLVFRDNNSDGKYTAGTDAGVAGVTVQLYRQDNGLAATTTTDAAGRYRFDVPPGSYYVKVPASMFAAGAPLAYTLATLPGASGDDNVGQDATDGGNPLTAGAKTAVFQLVAGSMPTAATGETGFDAASDNTLDVYGNLTIDLGFKPMPFGVGNLVFRDNNGNSKYDAGDLGIAGVAVRLFALGANVLTATPAAQATTAADGSYLMTVSTPGSYFVHLPKSNFATGGPLAGLLSSPGFSADNGDDKVNENGIDSATPATTGISSSTIVLAYGTAPTDAGTETGFNAASDNASDSSTNLTIDFGFYSSSTTAPLSGRVRRDLGTSETATTASPPLAGVELALYSDGNGNGVLDANEQSAVQTTTSASDGTYAFSSLTPGDYVVVQTPLPGAVATVSPNGNSPDRAAIQLTSSSVIDIDFMQCLAADTFKQWQAQSTGHGGAGPNDNADGGLYENLLRYALCLHPANGQPPFQIVFGANQTVDALFIRPVAGHEDIRYSLEGSSDLAHWSALTMTPAYVTGIDGTETGRFAGVTAPFVRLRVDLDANLDGVAEATSFSPVMGWTQRSMTASLQTFSMPLLQPALFAGIVGNATGGSLLKGRQYYAEAIAGDLEGQRWEVDELNSNPTRLAFEGNGPPATARVAVRAHWQVRDLFPPALFHGGTSASNADRVLFFDGTGYRVLWLLSRPTGSRWVTSSDATLADAGGSIVGPAEGVMVQPRSTTVVVPLTGQVRTWKFSVPLHTGAQLIGSGYPLDLSPADRAMTAASFSTANNFRLWQGDTGTGGAYSTFSLQSSLPVGQWTSETAQDMTRMPVFTSGRAAFIVTQGSNPSWLQPVPWKTLP